MRKAFMCGVTILAIRNIRGSTMTYLNSREVAAIAMFAALWGVLNSIFAPIVFRMFGLPILCDMVGFAVLTLIVWWIRKFGTATIVGLIATVVNFVFNPYGFHFEIRMNICTTLLFWLGNKIYPVQV